MVELLIAAMADPLVRQEIVKITLAAVAMVFHRRNTDPDYLAKSDAAFAAYNAAVTPEDKTNALRTLSALNSA